MTCWIGSVDGGRAGFRLLVLAERRAVHRPQCVTTPATGCGVSGVPVVHGAATFVPARRGEPHSPAPCGCSMKRSTCAECQCRTTSRLPRRTCPERCSSVLCKSSWGTVLADRCWAYTPGRLLRRVRCSVRRDASLVGRSRPHVVRAGCVPARTRRSRRRSSTHHDAPRAAKSADRISSRSWTTSSSMCSASDASNGNAYAAPIAVSAPCRVAAPVVAQLHEDAEHVPQRQPLVRPVTPAEPHVDDVREPGQRRTRMPLRELRATAPP